MRAGVVLSVVGVGVWLRAGPHIDEWEYGLETWLLGASAAMLGFLLISEWYLRRR